MGTVPHAEGCVLVAFDDSASKVTKESTSLRHPTVMDIARVAGVGQSTASRALSGQGYVSERARTAVLKAADELGYVPNHVARSLRARSTGSIGVLISDLANPFYADVANAVERQLRAGGYHMLLANSDGIRAEEDVALRTFQAMRVDGVIITPTWPSGELVDLLSRGGCPVVQVDRVVEDALADAIIVDNEGGALKAVRHLLELGHRRIGLMVGEMEYTTGAGRLAGYRRALVEAGAVFDPDIVSFTSFQPVDAVSVAREFLTAHPDVTAVFATNNVLAGGAFKAALELRLALPRDLSLVAFDDSPWMIFSSPQITTVAQSTDRIGQEAARMMLDRLKGDLVGPPVVRTLPTTFVLRDSTAAPPVPR